MSTWARLVCVLALIATPAAEQSTTEDGLRATLRGDYRTAIRILRPLADDSARPDPVAQFLLAILYDTGHGGDNIRACGLFLRAATPANPFMEQSSTIGTLLRDQLGGLMCVADERWQGGPPKSFVLGPDHRIVFADTSITVTHGDQEQRTMLRLPPGAAFLPIQYTPLAVSRPNVARRHFFQWLAWTPDTTGNPSSWTLSWSLSEVVGDQWIVITGESKLAVVAGPTPPASYDAAGLVQLRVNASGEAEFSIGGVSSPRTEVIPLRGGR
jgi:hypothetical protein